MSRIRDAVDAAVGGTPELRTAAELGECLDQGLRPRDILGRLYVLEETGQPQRVSRRLAARRRQPGELPPDASWPYKLKVLWAKIGLPEGSLEGLPSTEDEAGLAAFAGFVESLCREAREELRLRDQTTQAKAGEEMAGTASKPRRRGPKKCFRKAGEAYERACRHNERELEDKEAWEWLKEYDDQDYKLPSLKTFGRYVRGWRRATGQQKHSPLAGREGHSIVRISDIEAERIR